MKTEYQYRIGNEIKRVSIEGNGARFRVTINGASFDIAVDLFGPGQLNLELNGKQTQIFTARNGTRQYVALAGQTWVLEQVDMARPRSGAATTPGLGLDSLSASMPGVVLEVLVAENDPVERGQTLVLLEAMKMELRVTAPHAGRVQKVHCTAGAVVERGQLLVEIAAD